MYIQTFRRMGYKKDGEDTFEKVRKNSRTIIQLSKDYISIKAYISGYAESDYLSFPPESEKALRKLIQGNEA